jgi:predicted nucleic acid-binding protein
MNHLFNTVPHDRLVILTQAIGETLSIIVRRRNTCVLSSIAYQQASQALRKELITSCQIRLKTTDDTLVFTSLPLIEKHSINSTDALVLRSALEVAVILRQVGHDVVMIAVDARLLRAAQAEGLVTFNPETDTLTELNILTATH